jgi:hypothetical protein
VVDNRTVEQLD